MLPDGDKDQYGNPVVVRAGSRLDPQTGWPYEIWLRAPRMELVLIPAGAFMMGNALSVEETHRRYPRGEHAEMTPAELPQHRVRVTQAFYMGKYEVTRSQWQSVPGSPIVRVKQANPRSPMGEVNWDLCQQFTEKLSQTASGCHFRLPTEAEWEYACRAGTTTAFSFGDDAKRLMEHAWCLEGARAARQNYAHPVGTKLPNPWGLYDMHGNVWEWCQDWQGPYSDAAQADPVGPPAGKARICRGGAFGNDGDSGNCRSAARNWGPPTMAFPDLGLRVALDLKTRPTDRDGDVFSLRPAYPGFFVLGTWGVGVVPQAFQKDKPAELARLKQQLQQMKSLGLNAPVASALFAPDGQPYVAMLTKELGMSLVSYNDNLRHLYESKKPVAKSDVAGPIAQDAQRLKDYPNLFEYITHLDPPGPHFRPQDWREMCAGSLEADSTRAPHFIYFEAGPAQPFWQIRPMPSIHYMVYPLMGARPRAQWAAHATQQFEQFRQLAPDASHFPWIQACGGREGLTLPQPAELRAFTYLALAHGSKGVIFFCWHSKGFQALVDDQGQPTELGQEAKRLTAAIAKIGPVLMRLRVGPDIASVSANALAKTLVSEKGHAFVFVVNLDVAKAADVKVDIQPPAGQTFSGVRDVLEGQALGTSLSGGKLTFATRLEPGEGRLFRLCTAEAAPRSSAPFVYGYFL
ncbi:MAG: hypothetical protein FJ272_12225, partial [Planctomycetes bacterium]|nr:hypothetical protein [Planctomycetota bacterium]